jgi:hypothetical protein
VYWSIEPPKGCPGKGQITVTEGLATSNPLESISLTGISRRKDGVLLWTIEWILQDDSRLFQNGCEDTSTLESLYARLPDRLKIAPQVAGTKRKRTSIPPTESELDVVKATTAGDISSVTEDDGSQKHQTTQAKPMGSASTLAIDYSDSEEEEGHPESAAKPIRNNPVTRDNDDQFNTQRESSTPENTDENKHFFYLVKPKTSGNQRVLIRTSPKLPLDQILRRQEVLEFPTFQVLSHDWKSLPEEYILDSNYTLKMRLREEEMKRVVEGSGDLTQEALDSLRRESGSAWTTQSDHEILAVLQKDLARN